MSDADEYRRFEAEVPPAPPADEAWEEEPMLPRWRLPLFLFLATCYTTYQVGLNVGPKPGMASGLAYAVSLMLILGAHELGHFFQTLRYRVPASLPFFIPMPIGPLGTMGAVIGMHPRVGDRKAIFDIAITGPLAGLVPALVCCYIGLKFSTIIPVQGQGGGLGEPLVFTWMIRGLYGEIPQGQDVLLHPIAYAGWVGLLVTALNLIPIGQLDGGHILYTLLRRWAHLVATSLLLAAAVAVVVGGRMEWALMLVLLMLMGPNHPPTADDNVPLGAGRIALGIATLLFVFVGFTPEPFIRH